MDYKYLRAFLLTARHESFSKAAAELKIAQSAVSRQIRLLEEALGEQLIVRSSKRMVLTLRGNDLYHAVTDFDKSVNALFRPEKREVIRIGVLHGVLETWLISFIREHSISNETNLSVTVEKPQVLIDGLSRRDYDMVLTGENIQSELVSSLKLFDEELVFISKRKIDFKAIDQYCWISYDEDEWLHSLYKKKRSQKFVHVNSMTAIVSLVRADLGIAIVPTHILGADKTLIRHPVPLAKHPSVYLSTLNYSTTPLHLRPFMDLFKKAAQSE